MSNKTKRSMKKPAHIGQAEHEEYMALIERTKPLALQMSSRQLAEYLQTEFRKILRKHHPDWPEEWLNGLQCKIADDEIEAN